MGGISGSGMRACAALALVLLFAPGLAFGQKLGDVRAFVLALYGNYERDADANYLNSPEKVFTPRVLALMEAEARTIKPGDMGVIESDPLCDCQDSTGLTGVTVAPSVAGPGRVRADVKFTISSQPVAVTLDIAAVNGAWRVADVHSAGLPSLVGAYERAIAEAAAAEPGRSAKTSKSAR
jgi:hypothetical protein